MGVGAGGGAGGAGAEEDHSGYGFFCNFSLPKQRKVGAQRSRQNFFGRIDMVNISRILQSASLTAPLHEGEPLLRPSTPLRAFVTGNVATLGVLFQLRYTRPRSLDYCLGVVYIVYAKGSHVFGYEDHP